MIERIIELSIRNRVLVLLLAAAMTVAGIYAMLNTPVDAIPDLSENQVIVFTDWMGRSPREIEDQVTYPLSRKLQGLAGVKAVRSSSEFNFSMITIIFDDSIDFYFARQRVTERLAQANNYLPTGVQPYLAPDATALGQIFWYTVETSPEHPVEPGRLWALNKFYIGPQLNAAPGVADVAIVGGTPLEYQVDVQPESLRAFGVTLGELQMAIAQSNQPAGGGVIQKNRGEYIVRGIGWIKGRQDIENTVVKEVNGTPVYVSTLAKVTLGTQFRRSVFEKNGNDVTGGAVLMRHGENPLTVTERVKQKIQELQPGLPEGVHIVAAYDRTRLIHGAIQTLTEVMGHEMLIASVAILLILMHFRSVFVICITLPLSVLFSFLLMWVLRRLGIVDIQANIMSLAGLTISIGILVDQAIVMTENATHHLKEHFGDKKITGNIQELVIPPCRTVGRPTLVPALIPIFIKGRLRSEEDNWIVRSFINIYKPLLTWALPRRNLVMWFFAAMLIIAAGIFPLQALLGMGASGTYPPPREGNFVAQVSYVMSDMMDFLTGTASSDVAWKICFFVVFGVVTAVTIIATTGKRGRDVPFLILAWCLVAMFGVVAWVGMLLGEFGMRFADVHVVLPIVGAIPLLKWFFVGLNWIIYGLAIIPIFFTAFRTQHIVLWRTIALVSLVMVAFWVYHVPKIGASFMPALDEGTTLDMPVTVPRASVTEAADDLKARDALLRGFPEVESVIGKAGRADTPTDPAPLDMVETFVNFRPKELWPKRVLRYGDAAAQTDRTLDKLIEAGFVLLPRNKSDRESLIVDASQKALERFDEAQRELALLRYTEVTKELGPQLTRFAIIDSLRHMRRSVKMTWPPHLNEAREIDKLTALLTPKYGAWLAGSPTMEDVSQLVRDVANELADANVISDRVGSLKLKQPVVGTAVSGVAEFLGAARPTLSGEVFAA
ncbi:MAG: efflux RND transporter permease subunit, partial [Planctomycetia bacterium]|nr:efflux RND transporter permease subunit [Planctomycetia bacterium]